jgi:sugar lactone lactonase YvrE
VHRSRVVPVRAVLMAMVVALFTAACGGSVTEEPSGVDGATTEVIQSTTTAEATSTTTAPATTTTELPSTTTTPATPLEKLGYPVSDDWVTETVIAGIDAATGGLAIDADGVIYQADFGYSGHVGDSLLRIMPDGSVETMVQSDELESLTMTTFGPDGTLYQSSYGSGKVFIVEPDGDYEVIAEGLRGPTGIAVADDGGLFVEAYNSNIIHRIHPDGSVEDWVFDRRFNGINGIALGPDGTLYVVDHKDGSMFAVDQDGTVTSLHKFPKATSHVVYSEGSLFVTSRGAFVVFRYDLGSGDVEIIAGSGEPGDTDGRGSEASMGRPNAITLGPDGALYINHGSGNANNPVTIRRISYQP